MVRYKVDRIENGKKMAEKYLGRSQDISKESNDRIKNGQKMYEKYVSSRKTSLNDMAREYAAQHTPVVKVGKPEISVAKVGKPETSIKDLIANYNQKNPISTQGISSYSGPVEKRTGGYYHSEVTADPKFPQYRKEAQEKYLSAEQMAHYPGKKNMTSMTQEEKDVYDYLAGKEGMKRAEEYKQRILSGLNEKMTEETKTDIKKTAKDNPLVGVGLNAIGSLMSFEGYLDAAKNALTGKETDINNEAFLPAAIEEAAREGIKERLGGSPVKDFLIDTGMSITQNVARLPIGGMGLALAGTGAATGAYKSAIERDGSSSQALLSGAVQGGTEALFEKYSLEGLQELKTVPVALKRDFFKNLLKQGFTEGSEEALTELTNTFTDAAIMKELSNFELSYNKYLAQGLTKEEATRRASMDVLKNVGLSAAGGALSGGVLGGGAMALNYANKQLSKEPSTEEAKNAEVRPEETLNTEIRPEETQGKQLQEQAQDVQNPDFESQAEGMSAGENEAPLNLKEEVKEIFKDFGENGRNAAADNYSGGDMAEYHRAFGRYYDAGRYIYGDGMEAAEQSAVTSVLTPEQATAAYKAGLQDRNLYKDEYRQGPAKEGVFINQATKATGAQKRLLESIGEKTGLKITLVDEIEGAAAEYRPGEIKIAANSKNFLSSVSHELTHFMKDSNKLGYDVYASTAVYAMMESKGMSMDALVESYTRAYEKKGQTLSRDEIIEEIVADATGEFLNDEDFVQKIIKKDRSVARKVIDFLSDIIDSIKELINHDTRQAAKILKDNLREYELARELWIEGLEKAGEHYKSGKELVTEKETRYELKHPELVTKEKLEKNYEIVRNMEPVAALTGKEFEGKRGVKHLTEAVTEYYNSLGNVVYNDVVGDIVLNRRSVKDDIAHGYNELKAISFKAVPEVLKNGKVLQYTKNWKGRSYDSVVIGAQIEVASGELKGNYYQICTANVNKENNKMYLHEVQVIKTNGNNPFKTRAIAKSDPPSGDAPFLYSIFDKLNGVNDVKFQLDDFETYVDVESIVEENSKLQKANENLKAQLTLTKDYKPRKEDVSKYAGEVLKQYNSEYSKRTLTENLSRLYTYMSSDGADIQEASKIASSLGRSILEKARPADLEDAAFNQKLLKTVRETKMKIPVEMRADLVVEGGYSAFRRKYFKKLTIGNDGIGVDVAYEQLSDQYPALFPKEILNPVDQLFKIAEVVDEAKPKIDNPYSADVDTLSVVLGQELLDYRVNIRNIPPTIADKLFSKANEEEERYRAARKEYEEKMRSYKATLWEYENAKTMKKQIIRDVTKMQTWLIKPTDKEHVPETLRLAVAEFLSCIDYSSNIKNQFGEETKRTQAWEAAKGIYDTILANGNIVDGTYVELDVDIASNIGILIEKAKDFSRLEDMGYEELKALRDAVTSMKKSIEDVNVLKANESYQTAKKCGEEATKQVSERKKKWVAKGLKWADSILNTEMLDSFTFFERMGPAMYSTFEGLRNGFDRKIELTQITEAYFNDIKEREGLTQRDIKEWGKNAREFELSSGTIVMTPAQIMSLYELTKRPQARKHIFNKLRGIRTSSMTVEKEIKVLGKKVKLKGEQTTEPMGITLEEAQMIISTLTDQQKRVADAITKFFVDYTGVWGNEVSMLMYGYKKFNDSNYFPIKVDRNETETTSKDMQQTRIMLKNLGMTKSVVKDAKNAIIIEDIFEVFTKHADQMGSYCAFVPALSDFQKVYNFKNTDGDNLKSTIEKAFGKAGISYIENLLVDINGGSDKEGGMSSELLRNVKSASVGANLRTVIQQPTAYLRASVEIDLKYLAQGLMPAEKGAWEICKKYTKIAAWKDYGFFDINTGRTMRSIFMGPETLREAAIEKSMYLAGKGDEVAWTHLWMAVQAETKDKYPELQGEEFYRHCGKRMSYIIDRTQVVDSVFHRSGAMKKKKWDIYTTFMSEPTKSYNMLYRELDKVVDSKYKTGHFENKKRIGRAVAAYAATGALTAAAAAIWDLVRDDDDEKRFREKYLEHLLSNILDNLNPMNMIPILRDVVSIFSGYNANRMDMQAIQYLKYAMNEMEKYIEGDSRYNFGGLMEKWFKPVSMLTGIPVANAEREIESILNFAFELGKATDAGHMADYYKDTLLLDKEKNLNLNVKKALRAYLSGKKIAGDKIMKDLMDSGISKKDLNDKTRTILKDSPEIDEIAELLVAGKLKEYEEKVNELTDAGIDKSAVIKAVQSAIDKKAKTEEEEEQEEQEEEKDEPLYRSKDIQILLDAGNQKAAQDVIDFLYKEKRNAGRTPKQAKGDIKSAITSKYKEKYKESTSEERREIRKKLERIRVNGTSIYTGEDFKKWLD